MNTAIQTEEMRPPAQAVPSGSPNQDALLTSWLHGRSPHSIRAYQANIARFLAYVDKPLATVTLADLQGYADTLVDAGLAPASQARSLLKNMVRSGRENRSVGRRRVRTEDGVPSREFS